MLAVFLNVEFGDGLIVKIDIPRQRIIESLNKLNTDRWQYMRRQLPSKNGAAHTVLLPQPLAPTRAM